MTDSYGFTHHADGAGGKPALSVVGVGKTHAKRAIAYLRRRSILAFYRAEDKSLNTWELKTGRESTYAALEKAIKETGK